MGGSLSTLVGEKSVPARTLPDSFGLVPRLAPARAHPPPTSPRATTCCIPGTRKCPTPPPPTAPRATTCCIPGTRKGPSTPNRTPCHYMLYTWHPHLSGRRLVAGRFP